MMVPDRNARANDPHSIEGRDTKVFTVHYTTGARVRVAAGSPEEAVEAAAAKYAATFPGGLRNPVPPVARVESEEEYQARMRRTRVELGYPAAGIDGID